jgi:VanZ family protein
VNLSPSFVRYQLPAIVWALVIFGLSSIPQRDFPSINITGLDKVAHIILYGALFLFLYNALRHQTTFPFLSRYHKLISLFLAALYGASDELHQLAVPGRSCDIFDWVADAAGALLCLAALWLYERRHQIRQV